MGKLGFPGGSVVKNLPAKQEMHALSLCWEDPLEKEMATHSSILALEIPWIEEPGSLQSTGSQRVRHNCSLHAGTEQLNSQRQVRILDAGGCREERSQSLMGTEFQFCQMTDVLGTDDGDGCTGTRMHQRPPHCTLEGGENSGLCCMSLTTMF